MSRGLSQEEASIALFTFHLFFILFLSWHISSIIDRNKMNVSNTLGVDKFFHRAIHPSTIMSPLVPALRVILVFIWSLLVLGARSPQGPEFQVWLGCGDNNDHGVKLNAVSYMNAQHSNVFTTKSSRGASGSLSYVLQDCVLPWYKSPSNHKPNLPLKKKFH